MSSEFYTIKPINNEYIITLLKTSKKYIFFGAEIVVKKQYRGSCTVWHEYPNGYRCGTFLEGELNMVWKQYQWNKNNE